MKTASPQTIHRILGSNNILLIVADGYNAPNNTQPGNFIASLALSMAEKLACYAVVNAKYKREIMDLSHVTTVQERPKVRESFLLPIKKFKEEIVGNGLLPLVLILQAMPPKEHCEDMILFGYGQGQRASSAAPHRPTISPSLLAKIRMAVEDQHLRTAIAPTNSAYCGREQQHLNQLFRQKQYQDFYDPEVRSLLLTFRHDLISQRQTAESIALMLAPALEQFCQSMSLVRNIDINNIDTTNDEDLQYIFRLQGDSRYSDVLRESYIEELASSIDRNGLLHPLVLLKKNDGRYKILCGFRRFQALKRLHQPLVEAKVYQESDFSPEDFFNISLAENTRRRNLNPIEIGNFLESASNTLGLSNVELAEQFGDTLGIGKPGQKVSHSTIHKYRKVNKIRLRGESPEIISDVVNEKLQFSIAAELLAPIKNSEDRDALYAHIVKPFMPTRPQLTKLLNLLEQDSLRLHETIATPQVQRSIAKALASPQPVTTLIRLLGKKSDATTGEHKALLDAKVRGIRRRCFGENASKRDFNITPAARAGGDELIVQFRLKKGETQRTLELLANALTQDDLFAKEPSA